MRFLRSFVTLSIKRLKYIYRKVCHTVLYFLLFIINLQNYASEYSRILSQLLGTYLYNIIISLFYALCYSINNTYVCTCTRFYKIL